jgi:hypothetical protein
MPDPTRDQEDKVRRVERRGGVRLPAALVQANPYLYEDEPDHDLPCLVLISFDDELPGGVGFLRRLADDAFALKGMQAHNRENQEVQDVLRASDERAVRNRRRRLPPEFTGGRVVYAADLWLHRPYLRRGRLCGERILNVIAEPGDEGAVEHLPYEARARMPAGTLPDADEPPDVLDAEPAGDRRDRDERDRRDDRRRDADRGPSVFRRRRRDLDEDDDRGGGGRAALVVGLVIGGVLLALLLSVALWLALRGKLDDGHPVVLSDARRNQAFVTIDYRRPSGRSVPSGQVILVVRTAAGDRSEHPVRLVGGEQGGGHGAVLAMVQPGQGPWDCWLEVESWPGQGRRRISNTLTVP